MRQKILAIRFTKKDKKDLSKLLPEIPKEEKKK